MRTESEIEAARERASIMVLKQKTEAPQYSLGSWKTYEDGLREALDWVSDLQDQDPTKG